MKIKRLASGVVISAIASWSVHAQAADPDAAGTQELDVIMSVVDEDDTPESVIHRIELPPPTDVDINLNLPETSPADELDTVDQAVDELVDDATHAVSETLKDRLSSGDIDQLPDDIIETIPDEELENLLNDSTENVDDTLDGIDDAVDDLNNSLMEAEKMAEELDALSKEMEDISEGVEETENSINLDDAVKDIEGVNGL